MSSFEDALRRGLANVERGYSPSDGLATRIAHRTRQREVRRRVAVGVVALVALVAAVFGIGSSLGLTASSHYPNSARASGPNPSAMPPNGHAGAVKPGTSTTTAPKVQSRSSAPRSTTPSTSQLGSTSTITGATGPVRVVPHGLPSPARTTEPPPPPSTTPTTTPPTTDTTPPSTDTSTTTTTCPSTSTSTTTSTTSSSC